MEPKDQESKQPDAGTMPQGAQSVPRMVANFDAELEEMHTKMRNILKIDEPPPADILWRPDRSDFQLFTWPVPWLH